MGIFSCSLTGASHKERSESRIYEICASGFNFFINPGNSAAGRGVAGPGDFTSGPVGGWLTVSVTGNPAGYLQKSSLDCRLL